MAKQTVTAFYDSREYANNAALMLSQVGVARSDVTISPEAAAGQYASAVEPQAKGFWASLEEMFGGTDDHHTYTEGLRRGDVMLTAHVDADKVEQAVEILERHGSVDLNERETTWRSEGWTGGSAITGGGIANRGAGPLRSMESGEETDLIPARETLRTARADLSSTSLAGDTSTLVARPAIEGAETVARTDRSAGSSDVLQVLEETLNVGKRAVNRGKVRVHSYVVETPVVQSVSLRDETVTVDRRPVDRVLGAADLGTDAFRDQTIQMEEIDEEAVIAKTIRVVEEIGIRKDVTDRTHTVTDTVRSTKVDIDDGRTIERPAALLSDAASAQRTKGMEVLGADGQHVGVVDFVEGTTIKLMGMDKVLGGSQHLIPTEWVQMVDEKVRLKVTASDAKSRWTTA